MVLNTVPNSPIFQSTLPVRGATGNMVTTIYIPDISIHAPRAGSDPCIPYQGIEDFEFQSTLPVRGATDDYDRQQ